MGYAFRNHRLFGLPVLLISLICLGYQLKDIDPVPSEQVRPVSVLHPQPQSQRVNAAGEATIEEKPLTTYPLPELHSYLDIRTMLVAAGKPTIIPMKYEAILELRGGSLSRCIDGKMQRLQRGEMWQAAKGSQMTVQAFGELAVLRVIYLVPREK